MNRKVQKDLRGKTIDPITQEIYQLDPKKNPYKTVYGGDFKKN